MSTVDKLFSLQEVFNPRDFVQEFDNIDQTRADLLQNLCIRASHELLGIINPEYEQCLDILQPWGNRVRAPFIYHRFSGPLAEILDSEYFKQKLEIVSQIPSFWTISEGLKRIEAAMYDVLMQYYEGQDKSM